MSGKWPGNHRLRWGNDRELPRCSARISGRPSLCFVWCLYDSWWWSGIVQLSTQGGAIWGVVVDRMWRESSPPTRTVPAATVKVLHFPHFHNHLWRVKSNFRPNAVKHRLALMQNSISRHEKSVPQSKDFDVSYVWFLFPTTKWRNCSKCAAARCFCMCFRHVFRLSNTFWALWTISYEIQGGVKRILIRTNEPTKSFVAM